MACSKENQNHDVGKGDSNPWLENDIMKLFDNELKEYQQVYQFILKLQEMVERQRKLLVKYSEKFKRTKNSVQHTAVQTDINDILQESMPTDEKGAVDVNSFKEDIVQAAYSAVQNTGFVYEPVSGLYYDYKTGYYYNSELGLYYDGNNFTYYSFNEKENKFEFHSRVAAAATQQSTNEKSAPAKQQVTNEKSEPAKQQVTNEKSEPAKQQATNEKSEPAKQQATNEKSAPVMQQATNEKSAADRTKRNQTSSLENWTNDSDDNLSDVSSNSATFDSPERKIEEMDISDSKERSKESDSDDKEDGELSSLEDVEVEPLETERKYRTPLEYYNSPEYRAWYESYCKSVTVQYSKTPVSYDPTSEEAKTINPALRTEEYEIANAWPPCLRIMVTESSVKGLQVGTLFLVTCLGGTVGREGEHAVLIPDINISKHHGKIEFSGSEENKEDPSQGYTFVDLGSRNGTYLNGVRLSAALQESEPHLLKHGSELRIGSTKLNVHVHQGRETCNECEPGVLMPNKNKPAKVDATSTNQNRQTELKRLRKKFGLDKNAVKPVTIAGYEDRAERRRQTVGSLVEGEKTQVAHVEEKISNENKGFRMLSKMGWKSGQTLGKDEDNKKALIEPIIPQQYTKNAGLGCSVPATEGSGRNVKGGRKKTVWEKTQERYKVLGDEPPSSASLDDVE